MTGMPTKLRPKTQVSYIGSAKSSITTGTSLSVTLPAGLTAGQKAIFAVTHDQGAVIATPAGGTWETLVSATPGSATAIALSVYAYTIQAGDSGVAKAFTISGTTNQSACVAVSVYGGVGDYSVKPLIYTPLGTETQNNRPPRLQSVVCGPDDTVIGIAASYCYLSTAADGAEVTTPPTNFTLRQTMSKANNALAIPRGVAIMDADGENVIRQALTYSFTQISYHVGVTLALSPTNPRWKRRFYVPPTLRNKPFVVWSTSSNAYVRRVEANWGYNTMQTWGDQMNIAIGSSANSRNFALPGSKAEDICTALFGTKANYSTRATLADPMAITRACTFTGLPTTDIIAALDLAGNNIISTPDSQQARDSLSNAIRSIVRKIRTGNGGISITSQNAGITYTGTWTNGTSDGCSGGVYKETTVPGSKATMSINNTTGRPFEWEIVLIGLDSGALSLTGATFNVKVDNVSVYTGTTHNQALATGWGGGADYKFVQMVIPITIPTGVHSLSWEHTGANGDVLRVDSVHIASATNPPPPIFNITLARMPDAAYTTYPALSLAKQADYSAIIKGICDEFSDGRVFYYDPSASGIVSGQTAFFASDYVHQFDTLHANFAFEMVQMLQEKFA